MSDNNHILERLELLEQRYLVTRERLSKLERVQYQIRDQIGFIQFLSKDPSSQKPIEDRLTEIYGALGEILDQLDTVKSSASASASQFVPSPQPAIPAQPANPMHQTHAPGITQQQPSVAAMHKVPAVNNPMHQTHAPSATQQQPAVRPVPVQSNLMNQTHAPGATQQQPSVAAMHKVPPINPQPAIPAPQQGAVHPPINYKPRQAPQGFINR